MKFSNLVLKIFQIENCVKVKRESKDNLIFQAIMDPLRRFSSVHFTTTTTRSLQIFVMILSRLVIFTLRLLTELEAEEVTTRK